MKQYPIWIDVTACTYRSSKSYGAKKVNEQKILVGSSSSNSHEMVEIVNYKKSFNHEKYGPVISFRCKVDEIIIKEVLFKDNDGIAGEYIKTRSGLSRTKGLK